MKDDRRKLDRRGGFGEDIRYSDTILESIRCKRSSSGSSPLLPRNIDTS